MNLSFRLLAGLPVVATLACGGEAARPPASKEAPSGPAAVVAVQTAPALEREVAAVLRATGTFVPDESSEVTAQVSGSVIDTPVNVGDVVSAGQVIVRLDPRTATLDLRHAEAALQHAEAQAQNAKVEADRYTALVKSGDISQSAYEKVTTQRAMSDAAVEQARARVATAKKAVDDTTIAAPFAGHVSARTVSVGEYVSTSTKLVTIVQIQPIKLVLQVPETEAGRLRRGMTVRATVPTHPGRIFEGTVSALNVALDPSSRAMALEVRFTNADSRLMPGMFATADVQLPATERAVYVPASAVTTIANGQSSAVYAIEGTTAHVRVVQTSPAQDGMVRILAGLDGNAVVATSALDQLFDGITVRPTPAAGGTGHTGR